MTRLTLIRHGETDWNLARRIQGSTDIPLNDTGRRQAREAGEALRERLDADAPVLVAASDLSRARETAEIIAETLGAAPPLVYPALRERAYGQAEGLDIDQFRARWGEWHEAEVPDAETRVHLRSRAVRGVRAVVADARRATAPGPASLLVVSHGALIRELIGHASGDTLPASSERLPNGSAHDFLVERERIRLLSYTGATG